MVVLYKNSENNYLSRVFFVYLLLVTLRGNASFTGCVDELTGVSLEIKREM